MLTFITADNIIYPATSTDTFITIMNSGIVARPDNKNVPSLNTIPTNNSFNKDMAAKSTTSKNTTPNNTISYLVALFNRIADY
ncbi:hypothetical protein INT47_011304 [Mucor saturninus]|uniref:Uncharacterized protein n=1 Tax=Mucor saturninus TaxID=64648 RepID=A0A8H7VAD5_9FUNG|nr:hypothetical protein INT47_011304 [Mucor saturninus]